MTPLDLDDIKRRIAGSRSKPWRFVAHAYDDIAALIAEVARLRAERAWLVAEVLRQTGCTEAELTECMSVEGHKPVVNRRMGAEIRARHAEAATMRSWAEEAAKAENENAEDARRERAAVVAWLRTRSAEIEKWPPGGMNEISLTYDIVALAIERGEHRREENE